MSEEKPNLPYTKVENHDGLFRDESNSAIINVDYAAYQNHKKNKDFLKKKYLEEKQKEARLNSLEKEVASLKHGINQILDILKNDK